MTPVLIPRGWATTFVGLRHTSIEMAEISTFNKESSQIHALFALQASLLQTIHSPTLDHDGTSTLILPIAQMSVQRCMGPWRLLIKNNQSDRRRMEVGSKIPHYLGRASFFTKPNFLTAADKFPAGGGKVGYLLIHHAETSATPGPVGTEGLPSAKTPPYSVLDEGGTLIPP